MRSSLLVFVVVCAACATPSKPVASGGPSPWMCMPCAQPCTAYPDCAENAPERIAAREKAAAAKAAAEKAAAEKAAADKAAAEKAAAEQAAAEKAAAEAAAAKAAADKAAAEAAAAEALAKKDTDGDGVPDVQDNCPNEPGPASNYGCPVAKKQLVTVTKEGVQILQKVEFAPGKAAIARKSFPLLDQVAEVLAAHGELGKVEVQGHTDSSGNADKNRVLSQQRAAAVVNYLVKKKVDAARLTPKGYGPDVPIADNATKEGRDKNRRVEFKVVR